MQAKQATFNKQSKWVCQSHHLPCTTVLLVPSQDKFVTPNMVSPTVVFVDPFWAIARSEVATMPAAAPAALANTTQLKLLRPAMSTTDGNRTSFEYFIHAAVLPLAIVEIKTLGDPKGNARSAGAMSAVPQLPPTPIAPASFPPDCDFFRRYTRAKLTVAIASPRSMGSEEMIDCALCSFTSKTLFRSFTETVKKKSYRQLDLRRNCNGTFNCDRIISEICLGTIIRSEW